MSFLLIKPGFSINLKEIVAVEKNQNGIGSIVYTQGQQFESSLPHKTLISILGTREIEESQFINNIKNDKS